MSGDAHYGLEQAIEDLKGVLGDKLLVPPGANKLYLGRMKLAMSQWAMTSVYIKALGNYCLTNLNPPYEVGFVITQAPRIIGGAFDNKRGPSVVAAKSPPSNWTNPNNRLPE